MGYPHVQIRVIGIQGAGACKHLHSLQVLLCGQIRHFPRDSRLSDSTHFVERRHHTLQGKPPDFLAQGPLGPPNICLRVREAPCPRPVSGPLDHHPADGEVQDLCPQLGWLWLRKECICVKKTMRGLQNDVLIHPFCCLYRLLQVVLPCEQLF
jgi:hypothetical protein